MILTFCVLKQNDATFLFFIYIFFEKLALHYRNSFFFFVFLHGCNRFFSTKIVKNETKQKKGRCKRLLHWLKNAKVLTQSTGDAGGCC